MCWRGARVVQARGAFRREGRGQYRHPRAGRGPRCASLPILRPPGRGCGDLGNADKRVALILANYPNRDGRLGNGVGLDTPAGVAGSAEGDAGCRLCRRASCLRMAMR